MFTKKSHQEFHSNDICIIGTDAKIEGNLTANQALRIDGTIIGNVEATDKIFITSNAKILGDIKCNQIIISGTVEGMIHAKDVKIHSDASIAGDINYSTIQIDTGAQLESQLILIKKVVELQEVKRITG